MITNNKKDNGNALSNIFTSLTIGIACTIPMTIFIVRHNKKVYNYIKLKQKLNDKKTLIWKGPLHPTGIDKRKCMITKTFINDNECTKIFPFKGIQKSPYCKEPSYHTSDIFHSFVKWDKCVQTSTMKQYSIDTSDDKVYTVAYEFKKDKVIFHAIDYGHTSIERNVYDKIIYHDTRVIFPIGLLMMFWIPMLM